MTVYLLCGLPASGKTWVCERLDWHYVPNDAFIGNEAGLIANVLMKVRLRSKPTITDCPFGERQRLEAFMRQGLQVKPYFIIEPAHVLIERYKKRHHAPLKQAYFETRARSIRERAVEWKAPWGTSSEILALLKRGT